MLRWSMVDHRVSPAGKRVLEAATERWPDVVELRLAAATFYILYRCGDEAKYVCGLTGAWEHTSCSYRAGVRRESCFLIAQHCFGSSKERVTLQVARRCAQASD